jgi:membrane fusion protein (multidrug efflux system)
MRSETLYAAGIVLALILACAGCGGDGAGQGGGPGGMPPMPVETADASATGMTDEFTVVGDLDAEYEIAIVAEIAARVLELPFQEGQSVRRGERIARLDDAQLQAEFERAEALVEQRRATFERVRTVVAERAGAPQDLDDASADLAVAEADLALARARLEKAHIEAPFDGVVGIRRISPGAYVQPGTAITDLAQIDQLRVTFTVPETYLGQLDLGATVEVRTLAFPDAVLTGRVDVINPVLSRTSRSAEIVAHVDNPERRLRPGMSAEVTVVLASRPDAITVPAESVFFQGQQAFVYTVAADSTVAMAPVSLGTRSPTAVEITRGLDSGQTVVRAGHQKLFPGARVMPVSDAPPASDGAGEGASS